MIDIEWEHGKRWQDEHRTRWRDAREICNIKARIPTDPLTDIRNRNAALGQLFDGLGRRSRRVAILGSTWSQADLFPNRAIVIDTDKDGAVWFLKPEMLRPEHANNASRFVLAAGGTKLSALMDALDAKGLSLMTAGSHKGQSLAGAIATGTHGSFFNEAGLETHVRGMLFVAGTDHTHWIEDPANPVLSPSFAAQLGGRGHDHRFKDIIVHLGGLGYLNVVLLEVVPRFTLSWAKACLPLAPSWWDHVAAGNFAAATGSIGNGSPVFYELTFDPNAGPDADVMQSVYWRDGSEPAPAHKAASPGNAQHYLTQALDDDVDAAHRPVLTGESSDDAAEAAGVGGLINVPKLVFAAFRKSLANGGGASSAPVSLRQITEEWKPRKIGPLRIETFNAAICVDRARLREAMEAGFEIAREYDPHFVYTIRFAKRSPAGMGFLRFDNNAVINVDGLMKKFPFSDSDDAARGFCEALRDRGIPYSMHWGKDIPSNAAKIATDFGSAAQRWKDARVALVPKRLRRNMESPNLVHWGLD